MAVKVATTAYSVKKQAKAGARAANLGASADDSAYRQNRISKVHPASIIAGIATAASSRFKI